ncbi:hypothetical protein [Microcoleus sp. SVA1_B3]|uniref:hypothetical protein n=1 Tax=Microcoleus sp. SVA1_B3 TaxID=2818950 RepID=UPI002FD21E58
MIALARYVTIARLIVGTRHCRVLIAGNINSDTTGFDFTQKKARVSGELLYLGDGNSIALKSIFAIFAIAQKL